MRTSQLEIITQGKSYLQLVDKTQYNEVLKPHFMSSAGAHMRHIIDHFLAIISGFESGLIDYDKRQRGGQLETEPMSAIAAFDQITYWLEQLPDSLLNQPVSLSTEISVSDKKVHIIETTIARELIFVSSHAVHHYAMISQISRAQGLQLSEYFGIAPATATFLRQQKLEQEHADTAQLAQQA